MGTSTPGGQSIVSPAHALALLAFRIEQFDMRTRCRARGRPCRQRLDEVTERRLSEEHPASYIRDTQKLLEEAWDMAEDRA